MHRKQLKLVYRSVIYEEFSFTIVHPHRRLTGTLRDLRRSGTGTAKAKTRPRQSYVSKRRRPPQTTQTPTADAVGRGQSKRSRASISCETCAQSLKMSNLRQRPEPLKRYELSNGEGVLATDVASLTQDIQSGLQGAPFPPRKRTRPSSMRESTTAPEVSPKEDREGIVNAQYSRSSEGNTGKGSAPRR